MKFVETCMLEVPDNWRESSVMTREQPESRTSCDNIVPKEEDKTSRESRISGVCVEENMRLRAGTSAYLLTSPHMAYAHVPPIPALHVSSAYKLGFKPARSPLPATALLPRDAIGSTKYSVARGNSECAYLEVEGGAVRANSRVPAHPTGMYPLLPNK